MICNDHTSGASTYFSSMQCLLTNRDYLGFVLSEHMASGAREKCGRPSLSSPNSGKYLTRLFGQTRQTLDWQRDWRCLFWCFRKAARILLTMEENDPRRLFEGKSLVQIQHKEGVKSGAFSFAELVCALLVWCAHQLWSVLCLFTFCQYLIWL